MFLHGVLASPGNFEPAVRALVDRGAPVLAPAYGNRGTGDIHDSLEQLTQLLEEAALPGRLDIVGHSLGGLLGLRLAHRFPGKVRTLVGVGTPYRGVPLGQGGLGPLLRAALGVIGGPAYRQMMVESPFPTPLPAKTRVVSVVSDIDRIVPPESAELGEVHRITGVHHEHLPQQREAILTALDWRP